MKVVVSGSRINLDRVKKRNQNRSTVTGCHGMVCASQPLASLAGRNILQAGGNAVEAAIAANAMMALVEPMHCGPGGDLFAILWMERKGRPFGLNASAGARQRTELCCIL